MLKELKMTCFQAKLPLLKKYHCGNKTVNIKKKNTLIFHAELSLL